LGMGVIVLGSLLGVFFRYHAPGTGTRNVVP
jgi:hypothetical protein